MGEQDGGFQDDLRAAIRSGEAERQALAFEQQQQRIREEQEHRTKEGLQPLVVQQVAGEAKAFAGVMSEYGRGPDMRIAHTRMARERHKTRIDSFLGLPVYQRYWTITEQHVAFRSVWVIAFGTDFATREESPSRYKEGLEVTRLHTRGLAVDAAGEVWGFEQRQQHRHFDPQAGAYLKHPQRAAELNALLSLGSPVSGYLPSYLPGVAQPQPEVLAPLTSLDPGIAALEEQPIVKAFRARFAEMAHYGGS